MRKYFDLGQIKIAKNFIAQLVSTTARLGLGFVVSIMIGKNWGAEAFGVFATIIAFITLFKFAVSWGLPRMVIREVAIAPEKVNEIVNTGLILILVFSSITSLVVLGIEKSLNIVGNQFDLVILAILWLVLGEISLFFTGVFYAFEKMEFDAWSVLTETVFAVISTLLLLFNGTTNLLGFFVILVVSRVLNILVSAVLYRRLLGESDRHNKYANHLNMFKTTFPFGVEVLLSNYALLHIVMLSKYFGNEVTGIYKAAEQFPMLVIMIPVFVSNIIYPILSRTHQNDALQFQKTLNKGFHYTVIYGLFVSIILFIFSEQIIRIIFGGEFASGSIYIQIICLSLPFTFLSTIMGTSLTAAKWQGLRTLSLFFTVVFYLLLSFTLIPKYGAIGASVSLALTALFRFGILYSQVLRKVNFSYPIPKFFPVFLAALLVILFVNLAGVYPLYLRFFGALLIYAFSVFFMDETVRSDVQKMDLITIPKFK